MTKYRIYELSARAVMSYAVAEGEQHMFHLSRSATEKCKIKAATHEQDSNALFFQIMCELFGNEYQERSDGQIISDLSDIIFYMDFERIFDRSGTRKRSFSVSRKRKPCSARRELVWILVRGSTATSPLNAPTA